MSRVNLKSSGFGSKISQIKLTSSPNITSFMTPCRAPASDKNILRSLDIHCSTTRFPYQIRQCLCLDPYLGKELCIRVTCKTKCRKSARTVLCHRPFRSEWGVCLRRGRMPERFGCSVLQFVAVVFARQAIPEKSWKMDFRHMFGICLANQGKAFGDFVCFSRGLNHQKGKMAYIFSG